MLKKVRIDVNLFVLVPPTYAEGFDVFGEWKALDELLIVDVQPQVLESVFGTSNEAADGFEEVNVWSSASSLSGSALAGIIVLTLIHLELLWEIITLLPPIDRQMISLASRFTRSQAIHFIFGHLRYTGKITPKVSNIHLASKEVKEVIRKLELNSSRMVIQEDDNSAVIFQFLETLPNLQALEYHQLGHLVRLGDLSRLISSIRSASLLEFVIYSGLYATVEGIPTAGPVGLEKLSITWHVDDNPNEPGSSLTRLYALIRPSLTTLAKLRIDNSPEKFGGDFDLQLLKPAGRTLRTFEYTLQSSDDSILDTIPDIFPHLTKLSIQWDNLFTEHSDAHIEAISKNENLTDLTLSSDFEETADDSVMADWDYACATRMSITITDVLHTAIRDVMDDMSIDVEFQLPSEADNDSSLSGADDSSSTCLSPKPTKIPRLEGQSPATASASNTMGKSKEGTQRLATEPISSVACVSSTLHLRPRLPPEILDTVLAFLKHKYLGPVCLTNSFLGGIAQRRFYASVTLDSPVRTVVFLQSVIKNPRLAGLVRSLELDGA
ncbi:hypothetical protein NLJ89_g2961 [Agrocybe chaxingu]|uniref:F-box domain-containing protein n=1 Tax=Agrocybe chaxingu TaxID=84603 RepID=A0A9W8K5L5_9AGAR|nr:hypothetical protein NLJ89_g2961 [Agrocybe chaxingu]